MTAWNVTLFFVHLGALAGLVSLYPKAPCWMQKLSVMGFALGMLIVAFGFFLGIVETEGHEHIVRLGMTFEHLALLLWVFRLVFFPKGAPTWTSFLALFHHS